MNPKFKEPQNSDRLRWPAFNPEMLFLQPQPKKDMVPPPLSLMYCDEKELIYRPMVSYIVVFDVNQELLGSFGPGDWCWYPSFNTTKSTYNRVVCLYPKFKVKNNLFHMRLVDHLGNWIPHLPGLRFELNTSSRRLRHYQDYSIRTSFDEFEDLTDVEQINEYFNDTFAELFINRIKLLQSEIRLEEALKSPTLRKDPTYFSYLYHHIQLLNKFLEKIESLFKYRSQQVIHLESLRNGDFETFNHVAEEYRKWSVENNFSFRQINWEKLVKHTNQSIRLVEKNLHRSIIGQDSEGNFVINKVDVDCSPNQLQAFGLSDENLAEINTEYDVVNPIWNAEARKAVEILKKKNRSSQPLANLSLRACFLGKRASNHTNSDDNSIKKKVVVSRKPAVPAVEYDRYEEESKEGSKEEEDDEEDDERLVKLEEKDEETKTADVGFLEDSKDQDDTEQSLILALANRSRNRHIPHGLRPRDESNPKPPVDVILCSSFEALNQSSPNI